MSEALATLAHEAAEAMARSDWKKMGAQSEDEALGIFMHSVRRRWGSVMWRSWARVIHPSTRPPARHRAAERRNPKPWAAARARTRLSGGWRGRGVAAGAPRRRSFVRARPGARGARAAAGL
eukprot:scaffold17224_cov63-Phaeocystis_antarctica.AAC.2